MSIQKENVYGVILAICLSLILVLSALYLNERFKSPENVTLIINGKTTEGRNLFGKIEILEVTLSNEDVKRHSNIKVVKTHKDSITIQIRAEQFLREALRR
jgi:hypothetical protein